MHTRRIHEAWRGWCNAGSLWAAVLATLVLATAARGQERYELGEDFQWEQQTKYAPDSPEGRLQAVRKTLAEGDAEEANDELDAWIERYPNHPKLVEAYLLRGDAKVARDHLYDALYDYEAVIRRYPASEQYHTALQREFDIAEQFAAGKKRRLWGMRIVTAYGEAEEIFIRTQERAPGSVLGEKASMALGDMYFRREQMSAAAEAYDLFLDNYPQSAFRERAMLRLIYASLSRFNGPRFDPTGLIDARERIRMYQQAYPASAEKIGTDALLQRIHESLALKGYYSGRWYEQVNEDVSAIYTYRRVLKDYPQTPAAQMALARLDHLGASVVEGGPVPDADMPVDDTLDGVEDAGGDNDADAPPTADDNDADTDQPAVEPEK